MDIQVKILLKNRVACYTMWNELIIQKNDLYYTKQKTTVYISKNIHKKLVGGKTLRWTRFHWTEVEKFCFHDEIAMHITASKCPSVTLVRSLDLFISLIEKTCSQQYVVASW